MKKMLFNLKHCCIIVLALLQFELATAQKKDAYEMMVSGVKVIVQPSNNDIVEIQTIIKGGVQNYPLAKQGIESLAMSALTECGNKTDDKNSFKNKLDKVSAQVYGSTSMDYATISMNCIKSDFGTVWPLYVNAITTPVFDVKEFDRIKQDAINFLRAQESQPDYSISKMARQTAFEGKDYAKIPEGTVASVTGLSATETMAYYQSILTKARLVIVVVAELDKNNIQQKVSALLQTIPEGATFMLKNKALHPQKMYLFHKKKTLLPTTCKP